MAHQLGIVGSGSIACGLARTAAEHHEVVVWARSDASAARATAKVQEAGAKVVTDLGALSGCDIVVEAVAEDVAIKRDVYGKLGGLLSDDALLGTTTSSLSVAELADASGRPDRFAALHVFNPVEKMALVELSFPDAAADATRQAFVDLCERLGKTAVEVPDAAGFVVNRLLFPYLFDAVRLLERNGIDAEVDRHLHEARRRPPDGPAGAARLRRARRRCRDRRLDRRRGARARAHADRRGQARTQGRRRLLRVPAALSRRRQQPSR